jgi:exosortase K
MNSGGHYRRICCWWMLIAAIAASLKLYNSFATPQDLQWLLRPLAFLAQWLLGLRFTDDGSGVWRNHENNIAIVKSCAGVNFMVLSLFVYAKRYQPLVCGTRGTRNIVLITGRAVAACLAAAWCATLAVNTIRIVVSVELYRQEITFLDLSPEQIHRSAGVMIYFPALWLQFLLFARITRVHAGGMAALLYLGLLVFVPLLTGSYREQPRLFIENILVAGGLSLALLILHAAIRRLWHKFHGLYESWAGNIRRNKLLISRIRKRF